MNTTTSAASTAQSSSKFSYKDFTWCLSLFGTAVGAGVLFLPIKAGAGGFCTISYPSANRGTNDLVRTQISRSFRTFCEKP